MLKLYKKQGRRVRYWEAWAAGKKIVVHWGKVGDTGENKEVRLAAGETAKKAIARHAEAPRAEGFEEMSLDDHAVLIVQHKTKSWGSGDDLAKRHRIEELLNECLGWTGNGHCDGGDIGSGTTNVFSFVVDPHLAAKTVVATLKKNKLLEGAIVAFHRGEAATVLWPKDFNGVFALL
jgi:predicted DNA-binding WGR domain protein